MILRKNHRCEWDGINTAVREHTSEQVYLPRHLYLEHGGRDECEQRTGYRPIAGIGPTGGRFRRPLLRADTLCGRRSDGGGRLRDRDGRR